MCLSIFTFCSFFVFENLVAANNLFKLQVGNSLKNHSKLENLFNRNICTSIEQMI